MDVNKQNQRGDIEIKIGPETFILEPTFKNIDQVESLLGKSFVKLGMEARSGGLDLTTAQLAAFVAVTQKPPGMRQDKIRLLIHEHGTVGVFPGITRFINTALEGATEKGDEGNGEAKAN